MLFIGKTFDFDAAHFLPHVDEGHKCRRMHGHTYRVEFKLQGPVDERGMICDYAEISAAWAPIHDMLDHRTLNDVPGLENPTTEILAPWILREFKKSRLPVVSVRVYESSTTWCEAF
jgi:6-pyruvoyltetrahydropterin/6-carboxytetrahydropterin synthase